MAPPKKKPAKKANDDQVQVDNQDKNQSDTSDDEEEMEGGVRVCGVYVPPAPKAVCSSETTGPRLIITHIVNINFKSYAGRTVLGPFNKSFTSIVGPNGSGKSNVIDAMLFVFGFKTTKIRSKKLSVLMHKSESLQNVRSCTVEVHFQQIIDKEGTDFDIIPNSEIVISRTATVDNTSFYCINGKKSKFKDVAALLGLHGIDLVHNRFLILQGEVEQIAMMKPKATNEHETGMLEYLEDLIGTTRYRKPLGKLEVKVSRLVDERQEKVNRCKAAESDYVALKAPFESAKEYVKTSNKYATLGNKLFQKKIHMEQCKLDEVDKQKEEVENKISELKKKRDELQSEQAAKEKERASKRKLKEEKQAEKEKMVNEFQQTEFGLTKIKEDLGHTNKKRKKAMEAKKNEEKKLADAEKVPEKNKSEIEDLKKLEEKHKKQQAVEEEALSKVLASIKDETQGLQDQKDAINDKLIGLNKTRDDAKAKYDLAKTELDAYQNNEKKAKDKLEQLKKTLEEKTSFLGEKTSQLQDLETKLPAAEAQLSDCQKQLPALKQEEKETTEKLHSLKAQIQEKQDLMQASTSRNRVLDFIMKQKEKGILPGVFGRLGDLGGIDEKYDCAISTACGVLDFIVTDTVKTAKSCVEQLKKHDVGRGNFIVLDQQEWLKPQYEKSIKTPENVPRLFDLVKVKDNKVKPAFYYALRDTLVANDLAQAKRCAYGATRYRVVTLNGEIIEIAGTMSGGGREKRTGRMGRSATVNTESSSSSTQDLDCKVPALQAKVVQLHSQISQLEEKIFGLTRDTKTWKQQINNLQIEIKGLNRHGGELKNQIKEQVAVVKAAAPDQEEVQRLDKIVVKLKKDFDKAAEESGKLEKEVKVLTDNINLLTGGKMKEAQGKLDKVTSQLDKVVSEITKLTVGIQTSIRNTTKHKTQIENLTKEITQAEEKMLSLSEQSKELDRAGTLMSEKIEALNNEITEIDESLSKADSGMGNYTGDINKIKEKILEEKQSLETLGKSIQEFKGVIAQHQKLLNQLKLHEIEGEEDNDDENTPLDHQGACAKVLPIIQPEVLEKYDYESLLYTHTHFQTALAKGNITESLTIVQDFKEKFEIFKTKSTELDLATKQKDEVKAGFEELKSARLNEFMQGFSTISNKLKEMYQMITLGGDAELELSDSVDPFAEGVNFSVRPPKKSWKVISNLSGGEKTLSSLALVFALHYYKPSPLYVMDEIDAALDFKNVSIVANYIKERTKNAQFIIISLRSNMFELANVLVGIYKTYNCTKSTTITVKEENNDDTEVSRAVPVLNTSLNVSPNIEPNIQPQCSTSNDQSIPSNPKRTHAVKKSLFEDDNDRNEDVSFEDLGIENIQNETQRSRRHSTDVFTDSEPEDTLPQRKKLRISTSPE